MYQDYSGVANQHRSEVLYHFNLDVYPTTPESTVQQTKNNLEKNAKKLATEIETINNEVEKIKEIIGNLDETKAWETAGGTYTKKELNTIIENISGMVARITSYQGLLEGEKNLKENKGYVKQTITLFEEEYGNSDDWMQGWGLPEDVSC